MPIRKFRSIEEMNANPGPRSAPAENLLIALALSDFCHRLRPVRMPAGVHRHRSVEEMWQARQQWEMRVATKDAPELRRPGHGP